MSISLHCPLTPEEIKACIARVQAAVKASSIAYQSVTEESLIGDIQKTGELYTLTYLRCITEDRAPLPEEVKPFVESARGRVTDDIPLEALLNSYRVCIRTLWEFAAERATPSQLGKFAMLTLEFSDAISSAAADAFIYERERLRRSRFTAAHRLLVQAILGRKAELGELEAAAQNVGIGTAGPWTAIEVMLVGTTGASSRLSSERAMSSIHDSMQNRFGWSLTAVVPRGILFVVPHQHLERAERTMLQHKESLPGVVRVGYSLPCATLDGLNRAYHEADRAVEIGSLVAPDEFSHSYEKLMMFDMFREKSAITEFVLAVLNPLLSLSFVKQQRYLVTLSAFFECAQSRKRTAAKLGIHHNTLALRLEKIDRLLTVDLANGRDSFRIQLAIYLVPMMSQPLPTGSRS